MRFFLLAIGLSAFHAHADLYRWVDPQTGSVKFSSVPPPWLGDPEKERQAPKVEVVPYRGPGTVKPAPDKPAALTAAAAELELRWAGMLQTLSSLPFTPDFDRSSGGLQQQIETYQGLRSELDRLDPAGAQRRKLRETTVLENLRRSVEAQRQGAPQPLQ